jgi:hypothetical protein
MSEVPESKERQKQQTDEGPWGTRQKAGLPLPGLIAIGIYMLLLAAVIVFEVIGRLVSPFVLILVPAFVAASFGLLRMYRWAWALTLSAVFLLMSYNAWLFLAQKQAPAAVQGFLNLIFFFYLVREDVRRRLR